MLKNRIDLTRLRVDQNGSLVAPQSLREAFERHARGEIEDVALRAAQDEAIRDVVRKQEAIGWQTANSGGEIFRKASARR
jgi:5-methyltetrahydropteroyltriglutamate--homocysteine methyltransferase